MVTGSTTNQFAVLVLEISMAKPLRLDLWVSGLLFFYFANTCFENMFGRNTSYQSWQILQRNKATSSEQLHYCTLQSTLKLQKFTLIWFYFKFMLLSLLDYLRSPYWYSWYSLFFFSISFIAKFLALSTQMPPSLEGGSRQELLICKHPFYLSSEPQQNSFGIWTEVQMLTNVALGLLFKCLLYHHLLRISKILPSGKKEPS